MAMAKNDDKAPDVTAGDLEQDAAAQAKRERQDALTAERAKKPNLTRDSIEGTLRAKLIEQGKDPKDAAAQAKKRALEMVPD